MFVIRERLYADTVFCTCSEYNNLLVFRLSVIMCKRRRVIYSK